jgi:hypothetical protein
VGRSATAYRERSDPLVANLVAAGRLHRVHRGASRRRPHRSDAGGPMAGGGEGLWAGRGPQSLLAGDAVRTDARGGSPSGGDSRPRTAARPEGVRVHRTRSLHPEDVWRHRGIPTTSPERLLLDLAARLDDRPLRALMSQAQSMRLTTLRRLARQLDRAAGRPGRARYARVLASRPARDPHGARGPCLRSRPRRRLRAPRRRRAAGAPRVPRRAGRPCHLGAGDRPCRADAATA